MKTHTACIVVYREHRITRHLEFLVMHYQSSNRRTGGLTKPEVRFVAGTNKEHLDESPEETAVRKLLEETGLIITPEHLKPLDYEPAGRDHIKFGYLVCYDDCRGQLRRHSTTLNGDVMSHPFWMSAIELDWTLSPHHRWVYDSAMDALESVAA